MKSKERVSRALTFSSPDCVPLVFRTDADRSDIVTLGYGTPKQSLDSVERDEWGCVWEKRINTGLGQVIEHPLRDLLQLKTYTFPQARLQDRFGEMPEQVQTYADKYIAGGMGISGFNRMFLMRGFENLLTDIYLERDFFDFLANKVFDFELEIIRQYSEHGTDGIWFFDDWGTENGLFIDPQKWRLLFKDRYTRQFRTVHENNMAVFFHSCGNVWDIIPDLIEAGVDCLNLEQPLIFSDPETDGVDRLSQSFGGRVCFCTCPDTQRTLIDGSPKEIEDEVIHLIQAFRVYRGGLIGLADATKDHGYVSSDRTDLLGRSFEDYACSDLDRYH
jgi:uroporphyrinogen decarboxylase